MTPPKKAHRGRTLARRITVGTPDGGSTTMTVAEAICRQVEATGLRPTLCAHAGGVIRGQVQQWLNEGARHAERAARGQNLSPNDAVLARFWHDSNAAKERWISRQMETHDSIARGGLTTAEIIETVDPSQRDERGQPTVVGRRVKSARTLPDVRAIEWQLERLAKDEGFAPRTEVTGPDGGPVEVESREDREERLYRELLAFQRGYEDAEREQSRNGQNDGPR